MLLIGARDGLTDKRFDGARRGLIRSRGLRRSRRSGRHAQRPVQPSETRLRRSRPPLSDHLHGRLYKTGCHPPWEPARNEEGEICSRKYVGYDDCVKGYHCMPEGVEATACRKFCGADTDCPSGSRCGVITDQPPFYGVCWKTCTPFGNDCPGGTCAGARLGIDGVNLFESCREIGPAAVGEACKQQWNCGADMNCRGSLSFTCKAMCDDNHPCEAGACGKLPGKPNNGGVCP